MYYYLGYPILTDGASVVPGSATNPEYLTDWFTSRKIVTPSSTGYGVTVNFAEATQVDYVVFYDVITPPEATNYRIRVFDDFGGGGNVVLDSGNINLPKTFTSASALSTTSPDPVQLIYVPTSKATKRAEPSGTPIAKSLRINLNASPAASYQIGYVAAGPAVALSPFCVAGTGFDPQTAARGSTTELVGGAITDSRIAPRTKYPLIIRALSEEDAETLRELFSSVRDTRPFFLYPSDAPTSRALEYGVVRFAETQLNIRQLGTVFGSRARYSLSTSVTPWK